MSSLSSSNLERANKEKEKGNEAFKKANWAEAVGFYSAAILADPTNSTFPLNRAMTWIKLKRFVDAEQDCDTALNLIDHRNQTAFVKALYRRATARASNEKLEDALKDLQLILKIDPKNVDAKREMDSMKNRQQEKPQEKPKKPLDLDKGSITSTSSLKPETPDTDSNSVEAARAFLAKVGMEDPVPNKSKDIPDSSSKNKKGKQRASLKVAQDSKPPSRYPGEEGGFLREVTTRRLDKGASSSGFIKENKEETKDSSKTLDGFHSTSSKASEAPETASRNMDNDTQAIEDFFMKPVKKSSAPLTNLPTSKSRVEKPKISAYEFERKWREVSPKSEEGKSEEILSRQIDFLATIDFSVLSKSLGPLLEADLLSSLILSIKLALQVTESIDRRKTIEVANEILKYLPECNRFGMTVDFLDEKEKGEIEEVFKILEADGMGVGEIKKKWMP